MKTTNIGKQMNIDTRNFSKFIFTYFSYYKLFASSFFVFITIFCAAQNDKQNYDSTNNMLKSKMLQIEENNFIRNNNHLYLALDSMGYKISLVNKESRIATTINYGAIIIILGIAFVIYIIFFRKVLSNSINYYCKKYKTEKEANLVLAKTYEHHNKTKDQLIEYNKRSFINNLVVGIAHDLKTPIGNVLLISDTLKNETYEIKKQTNNIHHEDNKTIEYFNDVLESSELIYNEMIKIKEWIIGFQTITKDQIVNEMKEINLKNYIEESMRMLAFKINQKNIKYSINCNDDIIIETLPGFISQIIQNIVNNAIEHGFEGYDIDNKMINIKIERNNKNKIIISIFNNGKFINKNDLPKIYDEYFSTKKGIKGMGLSHVRKLIEDGLNGKIDCQSNEGRGVEFIISF
jgi:signal transduction histidine kinase